MSTGHADTIAAHTPPPLSSQVRVGIFALQDIRPNEEVTIEFDYRYDTDKYAAECPCGNDSCLVEDVCGCRCGTLIVPHAVRSRFSNIPRLWHACLAQAQKQHHHRRASTGRRRRKSSGKGAGGRRKADQGSNKGSGKSSAKNKADSGRDRGDSPSIHNRYGRFQKSALGQIGGAFCLILVSRHSIWLLGRNCCWVCDLPNIALGVEIH